MACTFNGLDLESMGTVGDQEVEYASFQTTLSSPQGHDGDVLSNFRRGPTTVKFNLAIDGTPAELTAKMNRIAAAMSGGMGELVMPDQTEGYHLDAVPNCALKPSVYHEGFVLPLEFSVPYGLARSGMIEQELVDEDGILSTTISIEDGMSVPYRLAVDLDDVYDTDTWVSVEFRSNQRPWTLLGECYIGFFDPNLTGSFELSFVYDSPSVSLESVSTDAPTMPTIRGINGDITAIKVGQGVRLRLLYDMFARGASATVQFEKVSVW